MRISDWSSDVCSSDLTQAGRSAAAAASARGEGAAPGLQQPGLHRESLGARAAHSLRVHGAQRALQALQDRRHHHLLRRSEEHTSELQSLMRISYAVFCLKKKNNNIQQTHNYQILNTRKYKRIK